MNRGAFDQIWAMGKPLNGYFDQIDDGMTPLRGIVAAWEPDFPALSESVENISVLVFSEIWCPDCVLNVSVLEKLASVYPALSVRCVGREGHEADIAGLNPLGKAYIPTVVFFAGDRHLGTFVERPVSFKSLLEKCTQVERIQLMQSYKTGGYLMDTAEEMLSYINR